MNFIKSYINIRNLYFFGLLLMAVGLPLSPVLMSLSQFFIAGAWLLEGNYKEKFKRLFQNDIALMCISVYLLHVIGLFYSQNTDYALKDLRIKFPLFVFPFVLGS